MLYEVITDPIVQGLGHLPVAGDVEDAPLRGPHRKGHERPVLRSVYHPNTVDRRVWDFDLGPRPTRQSEGPVLGAVERDLPQLAVRPDNVAQLHAGSIHQSASSLERVALYARVAGQVHSVTLQLLASYNFV